MAHASFPALYERLLMLSLRFMKLDKMDQSKTILPTCWAQRGALMCKL